MNRINRLKRGGRAVMGSLSATNLFLLCMAAAVVAAMWGGGPSSIAANAGTVGQILLIGGDTGGNLIAAGASASEDLFDNSSNVVQIYDPTVPGFVSAGTATPYTTKAEGSWAVQLPNGNVLVTGGANCSGAGTNQLFCAALNTAEIYNQSSNSFSAAGASGTMTVPRGAGLTVPISGSGTSEDGDVLIAGGYTGNLTVNYSGFAISSAGVSTAAAEIYDPTANTFTALSNSMITARAGFVFSNIANTSSSYGTGAVLIAGGDTGFFFQGATALAEIYAPAAGGGSFAATTSMTTARELAAWTTLAPELLTTGPDIGQILVTGGLNATGNLRGTTLITAELFDPSNSTWALTANNMQQPRTAPIQWFLGSGGLVGDALVAGGGNEVDPDGLTINLSSTVDQTTDIFDANTATPSFIHGGTMVEARTAAAFALELTGASAGDVIAMGGEWCNGSGSTNGACYEAGSSEDTNPNKTELEEFTPSSTGGSWAAVAPTMSPEVVSVARFGILIPAVATPTTGGATPTPTLSPTATLTATATPSPTLTLTPTQTATPSPTLTTTPTGAATSTTTLTPTPTPTTTMTPTPTTTATLTPTTTRTATPTITLTATPTTTATASPTPTAVPVTLKIAPKKLTFPKTTVGISSKAKKVKVSNPKGTKKHPGIAVLIEMVSDSPGVFAQTNDCPASLAAGASCTISVTFTPSAATKQTGSLVIDDNANHNPQTVPLSGTGKAPK